MNLLKSGKKYLINLLNDIDITSKDSIIDIGYGKGSAMRTMLKFKTGQIQNDLNDLVSKLNIW